MLKYVPWNWLLYVRPRFLKLIYDDLKTQEMCNGAIAKAPWLLHYVPLHFRTQEMCEKAVENEPETLEIFLITLRPKQCVKRPLKNAYAP